MKTAVSIPDQVYEQAETLAHRLNWSRSRVYANALSEYVARHSTEDVTAALDRTLEAAGDSHADRFPKVAAQRILRRVEW